MASVSEQSFAEERSHENTTIKGRHASVFDAVAGRMNVKGFMPQQVFIPSTRDTSSSSATVAPPEDVLFRQKNAPTRFEELDIYFANERDLHTELPESDLLKALHSYTSDFYSRAITDGEMRDYRSMDETALIALGILMEEAVRNTLGSSGDLVFTEGEATPFGSSPRAEFVSSKASMDRHSKKRRRVMRGRDSSADFNDT